MDVGRGHVCGLREPGHEVRDAALHDRDVAAGLELAHHRLRVFFAVDRALKLQQACGVGDHGAGWAAVGGLDCPTATYRQVDGVALRPTRIPPSVHEHLVKHCRVKGALDQLHPLERLPQSVAVAGRMIQHVGQDGGAVSTPVRVGIAGHVCAEHLRGDVGLFVAGLPVAVSRVANQDDAIDGILRVGHVEHVARPLPLPVDGALAELLHRHGDVWAFRPSLRGGHVGEDRPVREAAVFGRIGPHEHVAETARVVLNPLHHRPETGDTDTVAQVVDGGDIVPDVRWGIVEHRQLAAYVRERVDGEARFAPRVTA